MGTVGMGQRTGTTGLGRRGFFSRDGWSGGIGPRGWDGGASSPTTAGAATVTLEQNGDGDTSSLSQTTPAANEFVRVVNLLGLLASRVSFSFTAAIRFDIKQDRDSVCFCSVTRTEQEYDTVIMASLSLSQASSLVHLRQNPSLSSRSLHFLHFSRNQSSSLNLRFSSKRENGFLPKATESVLETNSSSPISSGKSINPIVVIDNYDSFTYNLCQYMGELGFHFEVYRNDELTVEELKRKNPRGVLISPGPGTPQDSGISLQTVLELGPTVPLFGVCMGLQCMGEAFGGKVVRSPFGVMHGKSSLVYYDEKGEDGLFAGLSNPFLAGRYHSLVIEQESFPHEELEVTAWTEDGLIMAARHKKYRHIQGVQFHPESIITTEGKAIVHNFVKLIERMEAGGS
ncbi:hypothetical protein RIF29_26732 [Crotalaria pallida]|uniref:anthranilate synthase n=1 Tax=Crotalaria pallida TaxID=3830 RepID=A0AAN9I509_CROPI